MKITKRNYKSFFKGKGITYLELSSKCSCCVDKSIIIVDKKDVSVPHDNMVFNIKKVLYEKNIDENYTFRTNDTFTFYPTIMDEFNIKASHITKEQFNIIKKLYGKPVRVKY